MNFYNSYEDRGGRLGKNDDWKTCFYDYSKLCDFCEKTF